MRIKSIVPTLKVYDLPTRALHLPGRGRAAGDKIFAEVTEQELACAHLAKAIKKKWIRVLKDKTSAPAPVVSPAPSVAVAEPNDSSDSE